MDVAPRVDRLLSKAVDEQVREQRRIREALESIAARLDNLEATTAALEEKIRPWSDPSAATADLAVRVEKRIAKRLDALEAQIDEMAEEVEEGAVDTLSDEVADVADELRKSVAELARLLVRDRGRIANTLTEHRNAILAELRLPPDRAPVSMGIDLRDRADDLEDGIHEVEDATGTTGRPRLRRLRGL